MRRKGLRFPNGIPRAAMSDNPAQADIKDVTVTDNGDLRDRIAYAIAQADGDPPGMEPASFDYELADVVADLLIDMAGKGELLKAIDRMHRG